MEQPEVDDQRQDNEDKNCGVEADGASIIKFEDRDILRGEGSSSRFKMEILETREEESKVEGEGKVKEKEKNECAIDVIKQGDEYLREEKVCRICHLSSSEHPYESSELIQLGCGCKGELGISHLPCAETWFKQKGNRLCEICGKTAKKVSGIKDTRIFMLEWNETRLMSSTTSSLPMEGSRPWKQTFCNILLACMVLAFVLPWFFRANML